MRSLILAAIALSIAAGAAAAEEATAAKRGTEGLTPVAFEVVNRGGMALSCDVGLAHWYSLQLGVAAHGVALSATLWSDAATGAVYVLNEHEDQMPVERLWCGAAGASWDSRREIALTRLAGEAQAPIRLDCAVEAAGEALSTRCAPR